MNKITPEELISKDIISENITQLKSIFPEAFTEDGVNFDTLRQLLGDAKVLDEGEEKYGLNWHGKKQARQIAITPSAGTLLPCKEESVDWDNTQNLFIEGDNLEVLKLLQKSCANKIKMIYIDPPYNKDKDFLYPDKFSEGLETYLSYTNQKDQNGKWTTTEKETSGRKHTNWLNMMYPRIKIARNLLMNDGVIFISIDDTEQSSLRQICDEIFGQENFLAQLVWHLSSGPQAGHFTRSNELILAYVKSKECLSFFPDKTGGTINHGALKKISKVNPASEVTFRKGSITCETKNIVFPLELGNSEKQFITKGLLEFENGILKNDVTIKAGWAMKNQLISWLDGKETHDSKGQKVIRFYFNNQGILFYEKERGTYHPKTVISSSDVGGTKAGGDEIEFLFKKNIMSFPKPSGLIKFLCNTICRDNKSDIILDYFSGSATTAHAVMQLNSEDGGNRKHIMVQLPEPCDGNSEAFEAGYKTIADIGKERIRRAGKKIKEELEKENQQLELGKEPKNILDIGFKVFKLSTSNFKTWNSDHGDDLDKKLWDSVDRLLPNRTEDDILYELLLKRGIDLSIPIETKTINKKKIYSIGYGALFACLDDSISKDDVDVIGQGIINWWKELKPETTEVYVFFKDSAFADDTVKTNLSVFLEQQGIKYVRSL